MRLVEKGVFQSKSEFFRQAVRDLLLKFETAANSKQNASS